jgi:hypothetical protein
LTQGERLGGRTDRQCGSERRPTRPQAPLVERQIDGDQGDGSRICPSEDSIVRLIGAVLFEHNDEWQSQHRYMQVEAFAQIDAAESDLLLSTTTQAA